jgi:iron complex transport system substrate-binding protein
VYEAILANMLNARGLRVERQKPVPLDYEGLHFEEAYRADLIVEGRVLVEIKSVERMSPVFNKQVLTYLRLLQFPVGLLINFGADSLNEGLRRIVNQRVDSLASADLRRAEKH